MPNTEEDERIEAILDGASRLPLERQECLLEAIKGMLYTRKLLLPKEQKQKQNEPPQPEE